MLFSLYNIKFLRILNIYECIINTCFFQNKYMFLFDLNFKLSIILTQMTPFILQRHDYVLTFPEKEIWHIKYHEVKSYKKSYYTTKGVFKKI